MPCTATIDSTKGQCGKPSLIVDGEPYYRDHCIDCIVIAHYTLGRAVQAFALRGFDKAFLLKHAHPNVIEFEAIAERNKAAGII